MTFIATNLFGSVSLYLCSLLASDYPKRRKRGHHQGPLRLLITLIPLLADAHHALLADLLGVSLRKIRLIHRSAGVAMPLLCLLHVFIALSSNIPFSLDNTQDVFAVIIGIYPQASSEN